MPQNGAIGDNVRPSLAEFIKSHRPNWDPHQFICFADLGAFRRDYVKHTLECEIGELTSLDQEVIESLREHEVLTENIEKQFERKLTFGEHLSDKIAEFGGSWRFIITFGSVIAVWVVLNALLLLNRAFDPYPFILLNLILSCLAALQAPVIMMSQNRAEARDCSGRITKSIHENLRNAGWNCGCLATTDSKGRSIWVWWPQSAAMLDALLRIKNVLPLDTSCFGSWNSDSGFAPDLSAARLHIKIPATDRQAKNAQGLDISSTVRNRIQVRMDSKGTPKDNRSFGLASVVERNIQSLIARRRREERKQTRQQRLAEAVTRFTGSMTFVYVHLLVFGLWIFTSSGWAPWANFDPTFVGLATFASVEAIFLSTFVLITQSRPDCDLISAQGSLLHVRHP